MNTIQMASHVFICCDRRAELLDLVEDVLARRGHAVVSIFIAELIDRAISGLPLSEGEIVAMRYAITASRYGDYNEMRVMA